MSGDVVRYNQDGRDCSMVPFPDGKYVLWDHFASAMDERNAALAKLEQVYGQLAIFVATVNVGSK